MIPVKDDATPLTIQTPNDADELALCSNDMPMNAAQSFRAR
jgi:hypothetical protein